MNYCITHILSNKERKDLTNKGFYCYDLRESDDGEKISTIEKSVLVNRVYSLVSDEEIPNESKMKNDFYVDYDNFLINNNEVDSLDDLLKKQEEFYKDICTSYIKTMNLEFLTEKDKTIYHGFFPDDEIAEKLNYGNNVKTDDLLKVSEATTKYKSYKDFYFDYVQDEIINDVLDIGTRGPNNEWDFYISEEDCKRLNIGEEDWNTYMQNQGEDNQEEDER